MVCCLFDFCDMVVFPPVLLFLFWSAGHHLWNNLEPAMNLVPPFSVLSVVSHILNSAWIAVFLCVFWGRPAWISFASLLGWPNELQLVWNGWLLLKTAEMKCVVVRWALCLTLASLYFHFTWKYLQTLSQLFRWIRSGFIFPLKVERMNDSFCSHF